MHLFFRCTVEAVVACTINRVSGSQLCSTFISIDLDLRVFLLERFQTMSIDPWSQVCLQGFERTLEVLLLSRQLRKFACGHGFVLATSVRRGLEHSLELSFSSALLPPVSVNMPSKLPCLQL